MNTRYLLSHDTDFAGELLRQGELVVFPTETVYGLGASAVDPDAVRAIFSAKGRPADNPLIAHFGNTDEIYSLLPEHADDLGPLIATYMPGPLTLVVPAPRWASPILTAGLDSLAIRVPAHPVAQAVISAAAVPVAAPSANRSGRPSPTTVEMAMSEMDGRVAAIVDGGSCPIGIESTVVDVRTPDEFSVLRPGHITAGEIAAATGRRERPKGAVERSPGTRYRHYRPNVPVVLVPSGLWGACTSEAERVCRAPLFRRIPDPDAFTPKLYLTFWEAERDGNDCIVIEVPPEATAPGLADRLNRAAETVYTPGAIEALFSG
ncbi:MAG: L-threonylcarbamoyladenylate synthase [Alkalispirochaeta sp.]